VLNTTAIWKALNSPRRLFLIAGPCVIESEALCRRVAGTLQKTCQQLGVTYVFKASFDKANRTSAKSFRGPGLAAGLKILARVRDQFGVPVLTDVHTEAQAAARALRTTWAISAGDRNCPFFRFTIFPRRPRPPPRRRWWIFSKSRRSSAGRRI
jgi:3-deoxy-D-arabino-heptulosonate 7-phosphate (DAHP) synthase